MYAFGVFLWQSPLAMHNSTPLHFSSSRKWKPSALLKWPFLSIPLLGIVSNTLVNLVFDFKYQRPLLSMSVEEYVNSILAAWILLGGTRAISSRLDRKLPWNGGARKRLFIQMGLHLAYIIIVFNLVLIGYTYAMYGGFYNLGDIVVIDICVVATSFLFSAIDSSIAFFANWRKAETTTQRVARSLDKTIAVSQGKTKHLVRLSDICYAMSTNGLVYIHTADRRFIYAHSLDKLMELLDHRFFRANRQVVLHEHAVSNFSSLAQGKILVNYGELGTESLTVSRTKAAAFRQWIRSTESPDPKPERAAVPV